MAFLAQLMDLAKEFGLQVIILTATLIAAVAVLLTDYGNGLFKFLRSYRALQLRQTAS